ncbi:MAG: glycoside hydrolase family 43 protein [Pseudarcicella sp.]|nr:glycoside hydrolase family 43 protein [Pseudarcicella sp.]
MAKYIKLYFFVIILFSFHFVYSQSIKNEKKYFNNPILPGFYPDPSLCRVGDDYYMVNSSFEWFPGVPIHHSKDLVNWKPIGYVLDRPSQLTFKPNMKASAGIWAPTIRYNNGVFYVIVTCRQCKNDCNCGDNFMVTATNPAGPWSEPVWIDASVGIDPSLYFEDDGTVWYTGGTGGAKQPENGGPEKWPAEHRIYIQQLDIKTGKLFGERTILTSGHANNAKYAEGPHIYKKNNKYVLLIGEGGTWRNHAVTAFTSNKLTGPYIANQENPVLTHRHLGDKVDISTTGHADIVETQNGESWAMLLGVRDSTGYNQLGRETFLTKVDWQGSNPIFNKGIGRVLMKDVKPKLTEYQVSKKSFRDEFDGEKLDFQWNFLRTPLTVFHDLKSIKGSLVINLKPETVKENVNPALIARRIQHFDFTANTKLTFKTKHENEVAGLVLIQNDSSHYRVEKNSKHITLYKMSKKGKEQILSVVEFENEEVVLSCKVKGFNIDFYYGTDLKTMKPLALKQDTKVLTSNVAGGFTGPYIGMYASSNGVVSSNKAVFHWFEYKY